MIIGVTKHRLRGKPVSLATWIIDYCEIGFSNPNSEDADFWVVAEEQEGKRFAVMLECGARKKYIVLQIVFGLKGLNSL